MGDDFKIETPKGTLTKIKGKNGKFKMQIEWNPGFEDYMEKTFHGVQETIDSEVLRRCNPFVPKDTGILIQSGTMMTEIGSGEVKYKAPYARKQYYIPMPHTEKRCAYWFEEMKAAGGKEAILNLAKRECGAK